MTDLPLPGGQQFGASPSFLDLLAHSREAVPPEPVSQGVKVGVADRRTRPDQWGVLGVEPDPGAACLAQPRCHPDR